MTTDKEGVQRGVEQRPGCAYSRMSGGGSFVGKRKKFVFNTFINFKPM